MPSSRSGPSIAMRQAPAAAERRRCVAGRIAVRVSRRARRAKSPAGSRSITFAPPIDRLAEALLVGQQDAFEVQRADMIRVEAQDASRTPSARRACGRSRTAFRLARAAHRSGRDRAAAARSAGRAPRPRGRPRGAATPSSSAASAYVGTASSAALELLLRLAQYGPSRCSSVASWKRTTAKSWSSSSAWRYAAIAPSKSPSDARDVARCC